MRLFQCRFVQSDRMPCFKFDCEMPEIRIAGAAADLGKGDDRKCRRLIQPKEWVPNRSISKAKVIHMSLNVVTAFYRQASVSDSTWK